MAVTSTKEYIGVARDSADKYEGKQLVYVSWDQHLLFASSFLLCPDSTMKFGDMVKENIEPLIAADPDADKVDWHSVTWLKANKPWAPDWDASIADNGIGHKAHLRFLTPGLNSLCGQ